MTPLTTTYLVLWVIRQNPLAYYLGKTLLPINMLQNTNYLYSYQLPLQTQFLPIPMYTHPKSTYLSVFDMNPT